MEVSGQFHAPAVLPPGKAIKVTEKYRILHSEKCHTLSSSPDIVNMIKPRRMSLKGHVARMKQDILFYRVIISSERAT